MLLKDHQLLLLNFDCRSRIDFRSSVDKQNLEYLDIPNKGRCLSQKMTRSLSKMEKLLKGVDKAQLERDGKLDNISGVILCIAEIILQMRPATPEIPISNIDIHEVIS